MDALAPHEVKAANDPQMPVFLDYAALSQRLFQTGSALILHSFQQVNGRGVGTFTVRGDDIRLREHVNILAGHWMAEFSHLTGAAWISTEPGKNGKYLPALEASQIKLIAKETVCDGDILCCEIEQYDTLWARLGHYLILRARGFPAWPVHRAALLDIFKGTKNVRYFRGRITNGDGDLIALVKFTGVIFPKKLIERQHKRKTR